MTRALTLALTAAALSWAAYPVAAQTAAVPAATARTQPPAFAMTVWAAEKGVSPGDVFAVTQDAEGYLWLGTPSGPDAVRRLRLCLVGVVERKGAAPGRPGARAGERA